MGKEKAGGRTFRVLTCLALEAVSSTWAFAVGLLEEGLETAGLLVEGLETAGLRVEGLETAGLPVEGLEAVVFAGSLFLGEDLAAGDFFLSAASPAPEGFATATVSLLAILQRRKGTSSCSSPLPLPQMVSARSFTPSLGNAHVYVGR